MSFFPLAYLMDMVKDVEAREDDFLFDMLHSKEEEYS